jgi:hypothetical protein
VALLGRRRKAADPVPRWLRVYLETGSAPANLDEEQRFICWLIRGRLQEGRATWEQYREAVLEAWQGRGRPWAEGHFE